MPNDDDDDDDLSLRELRQPFTPDLKLICFTNRLLHSLSDGYIWTALTDLVS